MEYYKNENGDVFGVAKGDEHLIENDWVVCERPLSCEVPENFDLLMLINELELQITPRRQREAILTAEGKQWLEAKEMEIEALRGQL